MAPGATQLTVTRRGASSTAMVRVSASMAPGAGSKACSGVLAGAQRGDRGGDDPGARLPVPTRIAALELESFGDPYDARYRN